MMSVAVKELKNLNVSESEIQQFLDEAEVHSNLKFKSHKSQIMKTMNPHQNVVQFL